MATNPVVYFDINIADRPAGRVEFTLRADVCPRTAENFRYGNCPLGLGKALKTSSHRNGLRLFIFGQSALYRREEQARKEFVVQGFRFPSRHSQLCKSFSSLKFLCSSASQENFAAGIAFQEPYFV
jgi:hypothetical protein